MKQAPPTGKTIGTAILLLALFLMPAAAVADEDDTSTLGSLYQWLMLPELDSTVTHDDHWPLEDPVTSGVIVDAGEPVMAGSFATVTVVYKAGKGGLKEGGGLRLAFEHGADWGELQVANGKRENYATVRGQRDIEWELAANPMLGSCSLLNAVIEHGKLKEGDTVRFVLGDRSGGSPGLRVTTVSEVPGSGLLRVYEDRNGQGHFFRVPDADEIAVTAAWPDHLTVIADSRGVVGRNVDIVAHVNDRYNNVVRRYKGWFSVNDPESGRRLGSVRIRPGDKGVARIRGIKCLSEGILRVKVDSVVGGFGALSNPIECRLSDDAPATYFGSVHNHTLESNGLNTMEGAATYGRDVSKLDFLSITEHVIWPDWPHDPVLLRHARGPDSWWRASEVARIFNIPGEFVTILGFDWTTTTYGDKNIYFFDDQAEYRKFPSSQTELYRSVEDDRSIVVTHGMLGVSGVRGPRWDLADNKRERVVQIASGQGVREFAGNLYPVCENDGVIPAFAVRGNYAEGALDRGLRLGFIAGSDDHSGKPGAGVKGILRCGVNGLTAIRADRLDRKNIFSALENRNTYATTGARMLLDFSVNGRTMGMELKLKSYDERVIRAEVHGAGPVAEVSIIKEDPREPAQSWKYDPPILDPGKLTWIDDSPLDRPTWYYLRVVQADNQMGWTSPVWVDPAE